MRMQIRWIVIGLCILGSLPTYAQETDTTVYKVVEVMPRFPGCEQLDTTARAITQCAEQQLLAYIYRQVVYPVSAREEGLEGVVVVNFVVEPDGSLSAPEVMKDIGGGCGQEVVRVINLMNVQGIKWRPGYKDGNPVRVSINVPVRFKLEEAKPYIMAGYDTIYVQYETPPSFKDGEDALSDWLAERLDYPDAGVDSCYVGAIEMQLLIEPGGKVRILNMIDYNDLGFDFWYEAIDAATSTVGKWNVATYEGREVPSAFDITLSFAPSNESCSRTVQAYQEASLKVQEGVALFAEGKADEGFSKLDEAITAFPDDANFLFVRGQMYLDSNRLGEACQDLSKGTRIALVDWYKEILPLICR